MREPAAQPVEPRKSNRAQINFVDSTVNCCPVLNIYLSTNGRDVSMDSCSFSYRDISSDSHDLVAYSPCGADSDIPKNCHCSISLVFNCNVARDGDDHLADSAKRGGRAPDSDHGVRPII